MLPYFLGNYLPSFGVLVNMFIDVKHPMTSTPWPLATEESYFIYVTLILFVGVINAEMILKWTIFGVIVLSFSIETAILY